MDQNHLLKHRHRNSNLETLILSPGVGVGVVGGGGDTFLKEKIANKIVLGRRSCPRPKSKVPALRHGANGSTWRPSRELQAFLKKVTGAAPSWTGTGSEHTVIFSNFPTAPCTREPHSLFSDGETETQRMRMRLQK